MFACPIQMLRKVERTKLVWSFTGSQTCKERVKEGVLWSNRMVETEAPRVCQSADELRDGGDSGGSGLLWDHNNLMVGLRESPTP